MRHRAKRAELDVGLAGLAILRAFPWGGQREIVQELLEKLEGEKWSEPELDIMELDVAEGYRRWSQTYDAMPNPVVELEQPVVRSMIDQVAPGVAVDAACGTGRHAAYMLDKGHRVIAVDTSEEMLERARRRLHGADVRHGDLSRLPVDDGIADLVTCALALTHFTDLERPMKELSRITKPGGHVIVSDVHPVSVAMSAHAFFKTAEGSRAVIKNHVHWPSSYVHAFRAANLDVVDCAEPEISAASIDIMDPPTAVRSWAEKALIGLPFVLIWDVVKRP